MKWFPDGITEEQAKPIYRKLARTYHPDRYGPDGEDIMKEINGEYASIVKQEAVSVSAKFNSLQERCIHLATLAKNTIDEIYPKTSITYGVWLQELTLVFGNKTPMKKMLGICKLIDELDMGFTLVVQFERGEGKKPHTITRSGVEVLIDSPKVATDLKPVSDGTRWSYMRGRTVEMVVDKKEGTIYRMKRNKSFTLKELLGF